MLKRFFLIAMLMAFGGCASTFPYSEDASRTAAVRNVNEPQLPVIKRQAPEEGSLWTDDSSMDLFTDRRAKRVGDILTVRIVEDPEAKLDASTSTSRSSGVSAAKLKFLGFLKALADKNSRLAQTPGTDDLFSASLGMQFDGKGSSNRNGHVKAYITAMVTKVLPNRHLYIEGKREIRVNNETQFIVVSGIVRPEDISTSNEISSTVIANARIIYSGIGPVSDKQKPGWLGRIVDHAWPF